MLSRLYKLIFDLGVCFSLGAFLLFYFGGVTLQTGELALLFVAAALSLLLREKKKRSLLPLLLLPALGWLLLHPNWTELLVCLPIWGYIAYVLISDRLVISRGEFLDQVRRILTVCLLLPVFMLVELHTFIKAIGAALPYLVVTVISIGFMLRHLRTLHGMDEQKGYYSQQIWEMMIFLVVCVLLTIARAPQNLLVGLQLLYQGIILPIISLIGRLIGLIIGVIIYLITSLLSFAFKNKELAQRNDEWANRLKDIPEITHVTIPTNTWVLPLLYSLGVILGLVILFFLFRWLIGERGKQKLPEGVNELREELEDAGDRKNNRRWRYSKEPSQRIRYYYMKYLLHLHSLKVTILPGDTTREVDRKYSDTLTASSHEQKEASKQLKRLYREARYRMQKEITGEEGELARRLYYKIKSSKRII